MIRHIQITAIEPHPLARKPSDDAVRMLARSIGEIGIINPLRVRRNNDGWQLIAGRHRLLAAQRSNLDTVPCLVVEDDDLHAELAMIDENLCRSELSPAERAEATARRKEIYLGLHPETAHGKGSPNKVANLATFHEPSRQLGETEALWNAEQQRQKRFTQETSEVSGHGERTVQRDVERGEKVAGDVLEKVKGTRLDTGTYLDILKELSPEEQRDRVDGVLAAGVEPEPEVNEELQLTRLISQWKKATDAVKHKFLTWVQEVYQS